MKRNILATNKFSFTLKLTILISILVLVPLMVLTFMTFQIERRAIENRVVSQLDSVATIQAERVNQILNQYANSLQTIFEDEQLGELVKNQSSIEVENSISNYEKNLNFIEEIQLISAQSDSFTEVSPTTLDGVEFEKVNTPKFIGLFTDEDKFLKGRGVAPIQYNGEIIAYTIVV